MESLTYVLRALIGIFGILGIAYLLSSDRRKVNWRVVVGGLTIQVGIAAGVLLVPSIESLFGAATASSSCSIAARARAPKLCPV